MTHRTVDLDGLKVEVFNTSLAAQKWITRNKGECIVVVRNTSYFQRKGGAEITVRLNASVHPDNQHILAAANTIADEIERRIGEAA